MLKKIINMLGIENIVEGIKSVFDSSLLRTPAKIIPGIIMICSLIKRPGLSCTISFGKIIKDLEKSGVPTGPLPDGTPNLMNILAKSVVCEIYRGIKEDANVQIVLAPESISVSTLGANAGGPVTSLGTNTTITTGLGLIQ